MNFRAVEANDGDLVTMFGTFIEIGGLQYTPQQKAKAICKIADDNQVTHKVHIYQGNGELPTQAQLNQRQQFNLSTFEGSYQGGAYTGYSGFWAGPAPPQAPTQQAVPQSSKSTNVPKGVSEDVWEQKDLRMARMNALNRAIELYIADKQPFGEVPLLELADFFVTYIYKNNSKTTRSPGAPMPSPAMAESDDGIPF